MSVSKIILEQLTAKEGSELKFDFFVIDVKMILTDYGIKCSWKVDTV